MNIKVLLSFVPVRFGSERFNTQINCFVDHVDSNGVETHKVTRSIYALVNFTDTGKKITFEDGVSQWPREFISILNGLWLTFGLDSVSELTEGLDKYRTKFGKEEVSFIHNFNITAL